MNIQVNRQQSLLSTAFGVLLRNLGPEKTSQLWQILTPLKVKVLLLYIKKLKSLIENNLELKTVEFVEDLW